MAMPDKLSARYLRRYGFEAPVIIDVGVMAGTPFLYEAFADRRFVLIDPLEESRALVARAFPELRHDFQACALGAAPGEVEIAVDPARLALTTAGDRAQGLPEAVPRRVPVRTLDEITEGLDGPFGLKVDTEGHELEVLRGAARTLARCEFVIAETSIKRRFAGGYRFSEVVAEMASHGFEVHSFLSGLTRSPRMSDVLFVPWTSPRFDMPVKDGPSKDEPAPDGPAP